VKHGTIGKQNEELFILLADGTVLIRATKLQNFQGRCKR